MVWFKMTFMDMVTFDCRGSNTISCTLLYHNNCGLMGRDIVESINPSGCLVLHFRLDR